jgi:hypothetical protein
LRESSAGWERENGAGRRRPSPHSVQGVVHVDDGFNHNWIAVQQTWIRTGKGRTKTSCFGWFDANQRSWRRRICKARRFRRSSRIRQQRQTCDQIRGASCQIFVEVSGGRPIEILSTSEWIIHLPGEVPRGAHAPNHLPDLAMDRHRMPTLYPTGAPFLRPGTETPFC